MISVSTTSHKKEIEEAEAEALAIAMEMIGLQMEGYAKEACPVDTGRLRNSITYATSESHSSGSEPAEPDDYAQHGTVEERSVVVGTNVEYAQYIEMGTSRIAKRAFLMPAAANHNTEYKAMIQYCLQAQTI